MVKQFGSYEEYKSVIADSSLTVIDFTAKWCGPCKMIAPLFEKMHESFPDANFAKVDVDLDETSAICSECYISAMPTFVLFRNGVKIDEMKGANGKALEALVKKYYEAGKGTGIGTGTDNGKKHHHTDDDKK